MMKKIVTFIMTLAVSASLGAMVEVNGIYYDLEGNQAFVRSNPQNRYSGSLTIPAAVTYNDTIYHVKTIRDIAFDSCSLLTSISLPRSVTKIDNMAFETCKSLASICVDAANSHFTSVDGVLFNRAKSVLIKYPNGRPNPTYTVPQSVKRFEECAFFNASLLTSLIISDKVTVIRYLGCLSLQSVVLGKGVKCIEELAFDNCSSITSITLGDRVTKIEDCAFYGCTSLTSINIPNSITDMGEGVFAHCDSLPVEDNLQYAGTYLIGVVDWNQSTYTIKEGTTWIGYMAFADCSNLTSLTIPKSVTRINTNAFEGCSDLTVRVPKKLFKKYKKAFYDVEQVKTY